MSHKWAVEIANDKTGERVIIGGDMETTPARQKMLDWLDLQTGWTHKGGLWPDKERRFYQRIRKLIDEASHEKL